MNISRHEDVSVLRDQCEQADAAFIAAYTPEAKNMHFQPSDFRYMDALHSARVQAAGQAFRDAFERWHSADMMERKGRAA